ncbi:hypothetical protein ACFPC0_10820 [Streptomyces andamanensis]|uniref:Uncharacterized protein n=1 Tax=Streptomyces andamanensis TaxID=1565035 RepID=A0ABV8TCK1_9ACTN
MSLPQRKPGAHLLPAALHQWHVNGDHPDDHATHPGREGKVVRYYRHPDHPGTVVCPHCHLLMIEHGWIDSGEDGRTVCPGDFILTTTTGDHIPIPADAVVALAKELFHP